jgi:hypothetical protein
MNADNQAGKQARKDPAANMPEGLFWLRYERLQSQTATDPFYVPTQREIRREERDMSVPVAIHSSMPVTTLLSPSQAKDYHGSLEWSAPMARRMSGVTTAEQDEDDLCREQWWRDTYIVTRLWDSKAFQPTTLQAVLDYLKGRYTYAAITEREHRGPGWLKRQKKLIADHVQATYLYR